MELGAPAAFARIVWHWDDFLLTVLKCARSCRSLAPALKLPIASAGRSAKVTAASSTDNRPRMCYCNASASSISGRARTRIAAVCVFAGAATGTALDAAQRDANSHCHIEISLQKGGFAVTNESPIDDPSVLSGVLTGVSFVGGLATGITLPTPHSRSLALRSKTYGSSSRAAPEPNAST